MVSLKNTLMAIKEKLKKLENWEYLGSVTGSSASQINVWSYRDLLIDCQFSTVHQVVQVPLASLKGIQAGHRIQPGFFYREIYLELNANNVVITQHPQNYSATMTLYGRK